MDPVNITVSNPKIETEPLPKKTMDYFQEQASMYGTVTKGNTIELKRNIMINNKIDLIIKIHVKRGKAGYPIQIQLGGRKPKFEGWETIKDMRSGDQISIPINTTLTF
jgi:hypothetical protein